MNRQIIRYGAALLVSVLLVACGKGGESTSRNAVSAGPEADSAKLVSELTPALNRLGGETLFIACQGCHTLEEGGAHMVGPNLYGIIGETAASRPGYAYSDAIKNTGVIWSRGSLKGFIIATEHMIPGTWMAYSNILTIEEVDALISYIIQEAGGETESG